MSRPSQPSGRASNAGHLRLRVLLEGRRCDHVTRQLDLEVERIVVPQLLGHLAADDHRVGSAAQFAQHAELVLDLRAAGDEHERPVDVAEQAAEVLELGLEQQAGVGGQEAGDALRRRMGAVRRAERVVDVEVPPVRQLTRVHRVVRRLAGVEARVLEDGDAVVGQQLAGAGPRPAPSRTPGRGLSGAPGASRQQSPRRPGRATARVWARTPGCACRRRRVHPRAAR